MIGFQRLFADVAPPRRAHAGDAAFDVESRETITLCPSQRAKIGTGLVVTVTPGYVVQVLPRSGLALDHGVTVANAPGLIDSGYRGELGVILVNISDRAYTVKKGDRIAQLLVLPYLQAGIEESAPPPPPDQRGEGGFGSTGR
jgi:dUTP pyrophosphatase